MKFLLLALIVLAVIWFARGVRRLGTRNGAQRRQPEASIEEMVRCAHCGVHLPRRDAVLDARGLTYCGEAHREAGPARS